MQKTDKIQIRVDNDLKTRVHSIFNKLGLSASQAINIFYHQVELQNGIPFRLGLDYEITDEEEKTIAQSIKEINEGKYIKISPDDHETLKRLLIID